MMPFARDWVQADLKAATLPLVSINREMDEHGGTLTRYHGNDAKIAETLAFFDSHDWVEYEYRSYLGEGYGEIYLRYIGDE